MEMPSQHESQKLRETAIVEALLRWRGADPALALKEWNREAPDALIEVQGNLIGARGGWR
jgi:hypothetical protein